MTAAQVAAGLSGVSRHVLAASGDPDEVRDACTEALRPHRLVLQRQARLATRLEHLPAGPISLNRLRYGAEVTVAPAVPEEDNFLVIFPVAGSARFTYGRDIADVSPGHPAIVGPYREFRFDIDSAFDQLILRMDRRWVESAARRIRGAAGPVDLSLSLPEPPPFLYRLLDSVVSLPTLGPGGRPEVGQQLGELVIESFLLAQLPSEPEPARVPSVQVRRAMEYLLAHLAEPIAMTDVAAHCGASLRSVQAGFRRDLDVTPGQWLREQRLDRAHRLLSAGEPGQTTVTEVAAECGFFHLGEFAAHFRARFGVTPSSVLGAR
ncbi:AraC family transcriptional regulator [Amycolatopsis sp. FDAARGOS 1241]|uniref:AraC family transcriptional regulator n=1 Tax=Amycolatopsis sp. FDAARGOS 1241 TaxID=2778070 RepID=UPI001950F6F9|nr:AraC family transcriptional regulator [Amycolatopsis sp. FDAARGOS 1241]QRP47081.1 AraC family transcriptional regulator [Amycolatopsis sp. FDAARGOS 1241]